MNEEAGDGGDAGVDKAFHSDLGVVEPLHLLGSVVVLGCTRNGCQFGTRVPTFGSTRVHHFASKSGLEQNGGSESGHINLQPLWSVNSFSTMFYLLLLF